MDVPEAPQHTTTLARFTALRRVALNVPELNPCQVCSSFAWHLLGTNAWSMQHDAPTWADDSKAVSVRLITPGVYIMPHAGHIRWAERHRRCSLAGCMLNS